MLQGPVEVTLVVTQETLRLIAPGVDVARGHVVVHPWQATAGLGLRSAWVHGEVTQRGAHANAICDLVVDRAAGLLAGSLLSSAVAQTLSELISAVCAGNVAVRLGVQNCGPLAGLPGESLRDPDTLRPLALHPPIDVYRKVEVVDLLPTAGPLRILIAIAAPSERPRGASGLPTKVARFWRRPYRRPGAHRSVRIHATDPRRTLAAASACVVRLRSRQPRHPSSNRGNAKGIFMSRSKVWRGCARPCSVADRQGSSGQTGAFMVMLIGLVGIASLGAAGCSRPTNPSDVQSSPGQAVNGAPTEPTSIRTQAPKPATATAAVGTTLLTTQQDGAVSVISNARGTGFTVVDSSIGTSGGRTSVVTAYDSLGKARASLHPSDIDIGCGAADVVLPSGRRVLLGQRITDTAAAGVNPAMRTTTLYEFDAITGARLWILELRTQKLSEAQFEDCVNSGSLTGFSATIDGAYALNTHGTYPKWWVIDLTTGVGRQSSTTARAVGPLMLDQVIVNGQVKDVAFTERHSKLN